MTGIYGNSQEDKINELKLEAYLNQKDYDDLLTSRPGGMVCVEVPNYNFPEYLNVNANFVQVVKFMNARDLSRFVYFVGIMADEKEDLDCRHWASDQLNAFLNTLLNRGEL